MAGFEEAFWRGAAIGLVPAIAGLAQSPWLISRYEKWRGVAVGVSTGGTTVGPSSAVGAAICAMAFVSFRAVGLKWGNPLDPAWTTLLLCFFLPGVALTIRACHVWVWSEESLSWNGVFRSQRLDWRQLVSARRYTSGRTVLSTAGGTQIPWPGDVLRRQQLESFLTSVRPDISINPRYW